MQVNVADARESPRRRGSASRRSRRRRASPRSAAPGRSRGGQCRSRNPAPATPVDQRPGASRRARVPRPRSGLRRPRRRWRQGIVAGEMIPRLRVARGPLLRVRRSGSACSAKAQSRQPACGFVPNRPLADHCIVRIVRIGRSCVSRLSCAYAARNAPRAPQLHPESYSQRRSEQRGVERRVARRRSRPPSRRASGARPAAGGGRARRAGGGAAPRDRRRRPVGSGARSRRARSPRPWPPWSRRDDRQAGEKALADDDGVGLVPERRDDEHVERGEDARNLVLLVSARGSESCPAEPPPWPSGDRDIRCPRGTAPSAVDVEGDVGSIEKAIGVEQHVRALRGDERAEKADAQPARVGPWDAPAAGVRRGRRGCSPRSTP